MIHFKFVLPENLTYSLLKAHTLVLELFVVIYSPKFTTALYTKCIYMG